MGRPELALVLALMLSAVPADAADSYRKLILTRNYKAAAAALQVQAKAGDADAQYQLGIFYRTGVGVPRDEGKALFWLQKAAGNGVDEARAIITQLSTHTLTDPVRDGVAPKGAAPPLLPLATVDHLQQQLGNAAPWTVEVAVRGLASPPGLMGPVDATDIAGETPLLLAARLNRFDDVQSLLAKGADPSLGDKRGWTPVMWAARNGNAAMATALFAAGAKPGAKTKTGVDAISIAAQSCQFEVLPALVKGGEGGNVTGWVAGRCPDWTSKIAATDGMLATALRSGSGTDVQSAIALDNKSINTADEQGMTPLHLAAARGDAELVSALVNANAKPNAVSSDGSTALMLAAAKGCLACVQRLLPYVDDINLKNIDGESALYQAVRARALDVVKELRQAGASEASRTIGRDTPVKLATRLGDQPILQALTQ